MGFLSEPTIRFISLGDLFTLMELEKAVEEYRAEKKSTDNKEAVVNYSHRLQPFLNFCEKYGFTETEDLTERSVRQYRKERVSSVSNPVSLSQELRTLRSFLRWVGATNPSYQARPVGQTPELGHIS
jgi:site-specific recombinase XerD